MSPFVCPLPLQDYSHIVMAHGGGGKLSADLVEHLILPALGGQNANSLGDSTVLPPIEGRIAISTDSYVVRPLFFPGSSIGELAINGTVNDLAMSGATPLYLTAAFILEEGLPLDTFAKVLSHMGKAAKEAGIQIVAGDTKVVGKGQADGLYINTAGVGIVPDNLQIGPTRAQPGDIVVVSGTMGDHGMAIMSVREGLDFQSTIESDCAPLHTLVQCMLASTTQPSDIHVLRDPTRGGLAASLNEIARSSKVGIIVNEPQIPISWEVRSVCELLGLDPLQAANEGKLVAIVAPDAAPSILAAMREHPLGKDATIVGQVTDRNPGFIMARTAIGGMRIIPMPLGQQLPRIC